MEPAEETQFLPGSGIYAGYAASQVFALPYYGLGLGNITPPIITDTLPAGEVGIRRGQAGPCHRRRDRACAGARHRPGHPPCDPCPPPGGPPLGQKGSGHPDRRREGDRGGIRDSATLTKQEVQDLPAVDLDDLRGLA